VDVILNLLLLLFYQTIELLYFFLLFGEDVMEIAKGLAEPFIVVAMLRVSLVAARHSGPPVNTGHNTRIFTLGNLAQQWAGSEWRKC
jgi:hypothetical protein